MLDLLFLYDNHNMCRFQGLSLDNAERGGMPTFLLCKLVTLGMTLMNFARDQHIAEFLRRFVLIQVSAVVAVKFAVAEPVSISQCS